MRERPAWLDTDFRQSMARAEDPLGHLGECLQALREALAEGSDEAFVREGKQKLAAGEELLRHLKKNVRRTAPHFSSPAPVEEGAFANLVERLEAVEKNAKDDG